MSNPRNKWLASSAGAFVLLVGGLTLWEGDVRATYDDVAMIATSCIGHTGPGVERGRTYTKAECEQFLREDLAEHTATVLRCVNVPISEKTYASFVMTSFNIGASRFCNSSALRKFNAGDYYGGCDFTAWSKARINGELKEVRGLMNRRLYEMRLCREGLQ